MFSFIKVVWISALVIIQYLLKHDRLRIRSFDYSHPIF